MNRVYRERLEIIKSILEFTAKSEYPVSKTKLWGAAKTNHDRFDIFYQTLVDMGCLKDENGIEITDKGLDFLRKSKDVMPYLEEFKAYLKE